MHYSAVWFLCLCTYEPKSTILMDFILIMLIYDSAITLFPLHCFNTVTCLQHFDTVGWVSGRASDHKKEWWDAGIFVCLKQNANDLHMVRLMPPPPHRPLIASLISRMMFTHTTLARADTSCRHVSVCPSVTSWCSEMAKCTITQTTLHDSLRTLVFWCRKSRQNSNGVTPNRGTKCRWGRLNAGAVAANWRLTRHVVN